MKKVFVSFLSVLLFLCFFVFQSSRALAYDPYLCGRYGVDCPLPSCDPSKCTGSNPGTCAKSVSCPSCSTTSDGCCGENTPYWSKWRASCKLTDDVWGTCSYVWVYDQFVCSTGDKCVAGENGLRAGNCDCSFGNSIYKYCCNANGNAEGCINYYLQDNIYPPEGVCPGGYIIDGVRVRSSPCTGAPAATNTPVPPGQPTPEPTTPLNPNPYCSKGSIESCDAWIEAEVPATAVVGDMVTIRAFEHTGWGAKVGSSCLYHTISYNVQGPTNFGFNATSFSYTHHVDSITTSNPGHTWYNNHVVEGKYLWNTSGYPAGTYRVASGYYGGHGDNCHGDEGWSAPCCDKSTSSLGGAYTSRGYMQQILGRSPRHTITLCAPKAPDSFNCNDSTQTITGPPFPASWSFYGSWNDCGLTSGDNFTIYTDNGTGGPINKKTNCQNLPAGTRNCDVTDVALGTTYRWQVEATNTSGLKTRTGICSFTVEEPKPWWQTTDGDVHAQGTITSSIPDCATTEKYLSLVGPGGSPGVVSWAGANPLGLDQGTASDPNWQANDSNRRSQVGFTYLANRLNLDKSKIFSGDLATTDSGTYYVGEALSLNGADVGTKKIIIFVDGNVEVMGSIAVDEGGFFALIAKGGILFDGNIDRAEGFYLTDGVINTGESDKVFTGEGSFVGWGGFSFGRDLRNGTNGSCSPGETFVGRPDLYINAPKEFLVTPSFFQEMAP